MELLYQEVKCMYNINIEQQGIPGVALTMFFPGAGKTVLPFSTVVKYKSEEENNVKK